MKTIFIQLLTCVLILMYFILMTLSTLIISIGQLLVADIKSVKKTFNRFKNEINFILP